VPLAVGVDAVNQLRDRRGIGRYVRALLRAWQSSFSDRIETTVLVPHLFPGLLASRFAESLGPEQVRIARRGRAARLGLDLVWYPWNGMTWTSDVRSVVTIHDVWPFVSPAPDARIRAREQSHYLRARHLAARFIAVSHFTKAEAIRHLGLEAQQIDVIAEGVGPLTQSQPEPAKIAGAERYVLFVGEAEERKDVATLMRAMALLPETLRRSTALVIAGRRGIENVETKVRIEVTGEVSDERLASLYAGAAAFAFPSRYEGFGLPVLEAMLYGAPVVASDAGSIPETGGDAALYFRAGDSQALASALLRVLGDDALARSMSAAGLARAASMTQTECARQTLETFERVARS
jgi:glycosyltransferase involved in cell wall biosynthesis